MAEAWRVTANPIGQPLTPIGFKCAFVHLSWRESEKERSCPHPRVKMIGGTPQNQHHSNRAVAFITNNK